MFPLILIGKNSAQIEREIKEIIATKNIPQSGIFRYRKNPNVIAIEQIREIQSLLSRAAQNAYTVILYDFETAKKETQNAFLKTLEEQSAKAQFILVSTEEGSLLPTIKSRCLIKQLTGKPKKPTVINIEDFLTKPLGVLFHTYNVATREKAVELCDEWLKGFRGHKAGAGILKEILKVRRLLLKNNLNGQIAIDHLFLVIKKTLSANSY